jgi:hypothetical protein
MGNNIQPESTPKERREKMDELQRNINPDPEGGGLISGMTKRVGYSDGTQTPIGGMERDYRRKGRL